MSSKKKEKIGGRRIRISVINGVKKVIIIGHEGEQTACHLNNKELVELLAKKRAPGHGGKVGPTDTALTIEGRRALEEGELQYETPMSAPSTPIPNVFDDKADDYDDRQLDKGFGV